MKSPQYAPQEAQDFWGGGEILVFLMVVCCSIGS